MYVAVVNLWELGSGVSWKVAASSTERIMKMAAGKLQQKY